MKYAVAGQINGWTFYEVTGHQFTGELEGKPLYAFGDGSRVEKGDREYPKYGELYDSLDHAMVAAVGEKHTGPRGAGGGGVGTAADWFMRMIGAGQLQEAGPDGFAALAGALHLSDGFPPVGPAGFAERIERTLENQGYVIARQAIG